MVIFEFTWRQNHGISNMRYFRIYINTNMRYFRIYMVFVPYIFDYIWYKNHVYSKIHDRLTCNIEYGDRHIRYLFSAHHRISNMLFSVFLDFRQYIFDFRWHTVPLKIEYHHRKSNFWIFDLSCDRPPILGSLVRYETNPHLTPNVSLHNIFRSPSVRIRLHPFENRSSIF